MSDCSPSAVAGFTCAAAWPAPGLLLDSSPARHASAHARSTGHPVITSAEPGERWRWCYVDQVGGVSAFRGFQGVAPLAVRNAFRGFQGVAPLAVRNAFRGFQGVAPLAVTQ